jgi:hypothetical protein
MYKKLLFILIGFCLSLSIAASAEPANTNPIAKESIKISMELTNIPITTAIAQIARAGEFSVAIAPEVPNTIITATFKNVPAELALQTVCDAAGLLNQKKDDNVYIVSPRIRITGGLSAMMKEMASPPILFETKKAFDEQISSRQSISSIQTCPVCKKQFRGFAKAEYCPYCGADMISKCKSCGKKIMNPDWQYCPYCGKKIKKQNN